jgi:hypothetical protein
MSQRLTLELSDEIYANLQQKANAGGMSLAEWIVAVLSNHNIGMGQALHPTVHQEEARQRFRSHAGAISVGYATGIDNESIDADLAKAYANFGLCF